MNDKVVNPRRIPIYTPENLAGDYEMKYETALALFRKHLRLGNREDAQVARAIARAWKPDPTNAWERDLGVPHEIALRCEKWMHEGTRMTSFNPKRVLLKNECTKVSA